MRSRGIFLILFCAALTVGVAYFLLSDDEDKTPRETVARSGSDVTPFDLDDMTKVFKPTSTGGVQTVVADDPSDEREVEFIQEHLRQEVKAFQDRDFARAHGDDMPGLEDLPGPLGALNVAYRDLTVGGQITYTTSNPELIASLQAWFEAQSDEQGAGPK